MNVLIIYTVGFRFNEKITSNLEKEFPQHEFTAVDDTDVKIEQVEKAEIIVGFPNPSLLKYAKNLKWLHLSSIGVDKHIDKSIYANPGIKLTNSSGISGKPISDHIIGLMIALTRNFKFFFMNQAKHEWVKRDPQKDMFGSTALLVGLGDVGKTLAKKLKALDMYTIAVKRTLSDKPDYIDEIFTVDHLDEVLPRADFVILCLATTPETIGIINSKRIECMKRDAYIINIGRGLLIDQDALYNALLNKRIAGAAIDVSTPEPLPPDNPLWTLDNLIITPHCSGKSLSTTDRQYSVFRDELRRFSAGEELHNLIDFDLKY